MADVDLHALFIAVQAVHKEIRYLENLLKSETLQDGAEIELLLFSYEKATQSLKNAYAKAQAGGSNFPNYEILIQQLDSDMASSRKRSNMVTISVTALTTAIKSIDFEIKVREKAMREGLVSGADEEESSQEILDMMKTLSELCGVYERVALRDDPSLPPLESWLPPNTLWR